MDEVTTLAKGMERVSEKWDELQALIAPLSDDEFLRARDDGWSVRDHVVHVTAWERSLLALLRGESRPAAIGLTEEQEKAFDIDAINAHILDAAAGLSPAEVRAQSAATHAETVALLQSLTDEDVNQPYSHYQPQAVPYEPRPVFGWIAGDTFEHYEEHIGWLRQAGVGS
jgi:uncharacterized damage-inducible protein DinB